MQKQVVVIHGGDTFSTYEEYIAFLKSFVIDSLEYFTKWGWKDTLQERLGNDYQVILPKMPNKTNAKYAEWKIWFEKLLPLLNNEIILVGHSLGGTFLAKYLSENELPNKVPAIFLVSAPFDEDGADYKLVDFNLGSEFSKLNSQAGKIFLYHSKDDSVVPFTDLEKYRKVLPKAVARVFDDRGHFNQTEFPELVEDIKSL